jgi:hypothetical protein
MKQREGTSGISLLFIARCALSAVTINELLAYKIYEFDLLRTV